jgi:hypothetical protein
MQWFEEHLGYSVPTTVEQIGTWIPDTLAKAIEYWLEHERPVFGGSERCT